MIRMVVAGWRGAREDLHGETVRDGLVLMQDLLDCDNSVLVLSGDSPNGGIDAIVQGWVTAPEQQAAGWRWQGRREQRSERIPGSGTGNYRALFRERDVDWLVVFPGPNDSDTREAIMWATRFDVPFVGFPIPSRTWGGRPR